MGRTISLGERKWTLAQVAHALIRAVSWTPTRAVSWTPTRAVSGSQYERALTQAMSGPRHRSLWVSDQSRCVLRGGSVEKRLLECITLVQHIAKIFNARRQDHSEIRPAAFRWISRHSWKYERWFIVYCVPLRKLAFRFSLDFSTFLELWAVVAGMVRITELTWGCDGPFFDQWDQWNTGDWPLD